MPTSGRIPQCYYSKEARARSHCRYSLLSTDRAESPLFFLKKHPICLQRKQAASRFERLTKGHKAQTPRGWGECGGGGCCSSGDRNIQLEISSNEHSGVQRWREKEWREAVFSIDTV